MITDALITDALSKMSDKKRLVHLPAELIKRTSTDDRNAEILTADIEEHGMIAPISVVGPYVNGTYKVVEGNRRIVSIMQMTDDGRQLVPCYIVDGAVSDRRIRILAAASKAVTRPNDKHVISDYISLLYNEYLDGNIEKIEIVKEVAKFAHSTERLVRKYMFVQEHGFDSVLKAAVDGELSMDVAYDIVKTTPNDPLKQEELAKAYSSMPHGFKGAAREDIKETGGENILKESPEEFACRQTAKKNSGNAIKVLTAIVDGKADFSAEAKNEIVALCRKVITKLS